MPKRLFKPTPLIVIDTKPFHCAAPPPSARFLTRLLFRPRMLLSTAAARQAAAAGRRECRLHQTRARASHFGTIRVARVNGRRAALAELTRAIFELRETKGAMHAAEHLRAKAEGAARLNERVDAAKLRRAALQLRTINAAIIKEERRLIAVTKRSAKLTGIRENRVDTARTVAVNGRRAAAIERLCLRGAGMHQRCIAAETRRDAALTVIASRARRASTRREAKPTEPETIATLTKAVITAAIATALARAHYSSMHYVHTAAAVSAAGAARAATRAETKTKAREEAMAVKEAVKTAAVMAGLNGHEAKVAATSAGGGDVLLTTAAPFIAAPSTTTPSTTALSTSPSVARSDTEDWHEVV